MLKLRVHTDFADTGPDGGHRLPVKRLQTLLDPPELNACELPSVSRKRSHIAPGRSDH